MFEKRWLEFTLRVGKAPEMIKNISIAVAMESAANFVTEAQAA